MKRLYKSRHDRMIDGVCGGIASYLTIDSTIVRIGWVILTLTGGLGILLYLPGMIIMPKSPERGEEPVAAAGKGTMFWGVLLIGVGVFLLLENFGFSLFHWFDLSWTMVVGLIMIVTGMAILLSSRERTSVRGADSGEAPSGTAAERLYRSRTERKIFGVCGGLGIHLGVDPTIVRILFVLGGLASFGLALAAYLILAVVVPEKPWSQPQAAA